MDRIFPAADSQAQSLSWSLSDQKRPPAKIASDL
jgi:hypothetical protein